MSRRAALAATAEAARSNCLLVARSGRIVPEWCRAGTGPGTAQEVWSASKSFTGTFMLVGGAGG